MKEISEKKLAVLSGLEKNVCLAFCQFITIICQGNLFFFPYEHALKNCKGKQKKLGY